MEELEFDTPSVFGDTYHYVKVAEFGSTAEARAYIRARPGLWFVLIGTDVFRVTCVKRGY